ncbi:MAG: glutamate--tRNA ligase [Candidatus Omnitrophica bacterium]|nr:glutamate--tRNA ligase [Candidatus Omnitrophota bacterium]
MVKVRFAPSPTGFLHVGSARTALFNWLFAKHEGGQFLLRIEDTDLQRSKKEFLDEILESLRWLGLHWDGEEVHQSQRAQAGVYRKAADKLLAEGKAYLDGKAVLLKITPGEMVAFEDVVHGEIRVNTLEIKDQVLMKSDGMPTYSFACVLDDSEMAITHVIRGDDHISNTPKQVLIHRALGLETPAYVHIPLILGADRSRLSKRHGAANLNDYRKMGVLPEAMVNFLSLLGWSPGDDREVLSLDQIIKEFDLKRIGKTGAMFDLKKLLWMNSQYMQKASLETLLPLVQAMLKKRKWWDDDSEPGWVGRVVDLYKGRAETVAKLLDQAQGLFDEAVLYDPEAVALRLKQPGVSERLTAFADRLEKLPRWDAASIEQACRGLAEELQVKAADLIHPARVAVTGRSVGPSLFHVLEVAGRERVIPRLRQAATSLCSVS